MKHAGTLIAAVIAFLLAGEVIQLAQDPHTALAGLVIGFVGMGLLLSLCSSK